MDKIRDWFLNKFLPAWAKESVYLENRMLRKQLADKQQELERLQAYADGLEYALRRRVVIRNEVKS